MFSKFGNEHRDEINEILGLIEFIDEEYVKERYPEIYNFGPGRLGIHFEDKLALLDHKALIPRETSTDNSIISRKPLKHIRV